MERLTAPIRAAGSRGPSSRSAWLKADEAIPAPATSIHFGKAQTETELTLTPGKHTLQLVAGDNVHRQFEPTVASKVITITVK